MLEVKKKALENRCYELTRGDLIVMRFRLRTTLCIRDENRSVALGVEEREDLRSAFMADC